MNWIPWTDASKDIPFKSTTTGVGDGEEKVARELNTQVLGQNSPYDMKPILNGVPKECDVKKLDTQNDFNTGVKGRNALRLIKTKHVKLLESLHAFVESPMFTPEEQEALRFFAETSPDELAVGTLRRLNDVCKMLHTKQAALLADLPIVQPYHNAAGPVSMPLDLYYTICERLQEPFPASYRPYEPTLHILKHMDHEYIKDPTRFLEDLHGLVSIMNDVTLIIVHEQKGYMFIDDIRRIRFYRITRGHPRFQVVF